MDCSGGARHGELFAPACDRDLRRILVRGVRGSTGQRHGRRRGFLLRRREWESVRKLLAAGAAFAVPIALEIGVQCR